MISFRRACGFFTGFRENPSAATGVEEMYGQCKRFSSPDHLVALPREWNENVEYHAERALRFRIEQQAVTAYSWGSFAARHYAKACQVRGLKIKLLILIDPVYRARIIPRRSPNWLQFAPSALLVRKMTIPANVERVLWWRQEMTVPKGVRTLVAEDPHNTTIEFAGVIDTPHVRMDNHPGIQARVFSEIEDFMQ